MINRSKFWVVLAVAVTLMCGAQAQAMETLSSSQLVPGMRGYAKTVIEGTNIETFDIEIIGVLQDSAENEGKIIARASGDLIERTGGVLQGMSGSPVYVDGKLVGAVAGGWKDVDNRMCLLTPIGDMLKLWKMPDYKNNAKIKQVDFKARIPKTQTIVDDRNKADKPEIKNDGKSEIKSDDKKNSKPEIKTDDKKDSRQDIKKSEQNDAKQEPNKDKKAVADDNKEQKLLMTPLMVSGFGEAGLSFLQEKLAPYQMTPYSSGVGSGQGRGAALEPGSSIGVQIVRGDMSMAAIGTVTAVENGKILAFGHPFLRKGNVNYFMTDAEIIATASGQTSGFKIGMPGRLVGRINQDRSSAIAGVIGAYPSVVPLKITVEDAQLASKKSYDMQIAYDEELLATVAATMTYNAMDLSRDRLGTGTAKVAFEIMTNSASNGKFVRDNLFYNVQDVGQIAISELLQTVNLLATNSMEESDIVGIKVDIKLDEARKTASILEVRPDKTSVKPGESVNLRIKIKPYRKEEEIFTVSYKVPKNQKPGIINMEARGGGLVPLIQVLLQQQGVDLTAEEDKMKPLRTKLDELAQSNKNNEIIIGAAPMMPEQMAEMNKPSAAVKQQPVKEAAKEENKVNEPAVNSMATNLTFKHATGYVIDNAKQFVLQVE